MKKLLFIEANTTGTGMLAISKAKEIGFSPVFITNNPKRYIGLEEMECTVLECDTNNIDVVREMIRSQFEAFEVSGVTTTSEFYIETVAVIAKDLGLIGNSLDTVKNCRDKARMRSLLQNVPHVYSPWFHSIAAVNDLEGIRDCIVFPCVVKPVDDSGSNNVLKCYSYEEVQLQVERILSKTHNVRLQRNIKNVLIEEYIEGQEYSVEVFSYNGKSHVFGITQKCVGQEPYFVEEGHIFPAVIPKDLQLIVEKGITSILNKVNWQNGPCHLEIKIKEDNVFLVEFNGRLAGGMIPELIRYATQVDLLKEQLKTVTGTAPNLDKVSSLYAGIRFIVPTNEGEITSVLGFEQIKDMLGIKEVKCRTVIGETVQKAQNAYGRIGHVIGVSENSVELQSLLEKCINSLNIEVKGCGAID